jgi:hypothetical protein
MSAEKRAEVGRRGGKKSQKSGNGHQWTAKEAKAARKKRTDKSKPKKPKKKLAKKKKPK